MTILRWYIAPELERLRSQAEALLERTPAQPPQTLSEATPWKPAAALQDQSDRYELQVQLPGIDPKALAIEAQGDRIRIRGQRAATQGQILHSEFRTGPFERNVTLPEAIQPQKVSARYEQGILTLSLPKLNAQKEYRVPVSFGTTTEISGAATTSEISQQEAVEAIAAKAPISEDIWAEAAV